MTIEEAIDAALDRWSGAELRWGVDDCACAVADIYVALGRPDPARAFRGRYRTRRGALRVLGRGGLEPAVAAAAGAAGWPGIAPADASTGALGLIMTADGPACVIRRARHMWIGRIDHGFAASPDAAVYRAWAAV